MTDQEAVRYLKGRVRALLTEVRNRNAGKQTYEIYTNSRIFLELDKALSLLRYPPEVRHHYDSVLTKSWVGVGLDGVLAYYAGWHGCDHIGEPIRPMLERVKTWLDAGQPVKIVTARVHPMYPYCDRSREAIQDWCWQHLDHYLEVVHGKDFNMIELWDNRAIQVKHNTGERIGE